MNLTSHIDELRKKHANLSEAIESAQKAPSTDALNLSELKKKKLLIKEEINRLSTS